MNIKEFRAQHPQYKDMNDTDLSLALHSKFYSDIPKHDFDMMFIGRPNHDDLQSAAVTANDSLMLQDIDSTIKPVIVGTNKEVLDLKRAGKIGRDKVLFLAPQGKAYVIDPKAVQGIYGGSAAGAIKMAKMDILKGNDTKLLGYPNRKGATVDVVVNKQGEIITELPRITDEAKKGNIAYAAQATPEDAIKKGVEVAQAIQRKQPRKWKVMGEDPQNIKPAINVDGRILHGGDTHDDILNNHGIDLDEGERGFTTPSGEFMSRDDSMDYLAENQPEIFEKVQDKGELHSQNLNKVYNES